MRLPRSILFGRCGLSSAKLQPPRLVFRSLRFDAIHQTRLNSTSPSTSTPGPISLPPEGYVDLSPLRGLLGLHGPDAAEFLDGLITNKLPSESEPQGTFTSFLSPQVNPPWYFELISGTSPLRCLYLYYHYDGSRMGPSLRCPPISYRGR